MLEFRLNGLSSEIPDQALRFETTLEYVDLCEGGLVENRACFDSAILYTVLLQDGALYFSTPRTYKSQLDRSQTKNSVSFLFALTVVWINRVPAFGNQ